MWAAAYRLELPTRGHNTNNILEANNRVFKDVLMGWVMAYNIVHALRRLVDDLDRVFADRIADRITPQFSLEVNGRRRRVLRAQPHSSLCAGVCEEGAARYAGQGLRGGR
jgi:hypothetical protein